jgi:O-antigen ligase
MTKKLLNPFFIFHLVFVALVLVGTLPRQLVLYETGLLIIYFLFASVEAGLIFFVRAIPLFIAIPLTASYDNLNQWRILAIILFLKWLFERGTFHYIGSLLILFLRKPWAIIKEHPWAMLFKILMWLAIFSLWHASNQTEGLKRVIYFLNASLVGIVIAFPPRSKEFFGRLIRNIRIPVIIAVLVGVVQVISTYFMDIYQFMNVWGEGIQFREFGSVWSYIAVHVGNTWLAYFGDQLSLRVFSLFPDSHSFPIFLLLGLPAFFAWALVKPLEKAGQLTKMFCTRGTFAVLWIPLILLMLILSGTRGIWLAGVAMTIWSVIVLIYMKYRNAGQQHTNTFVYLSYYLIAFFLLFAVAYPIFASPQFLVSKGNNLLLERRFKSILDFGETSNAQRIEIWKKSLVSIARHPLLGVGIGNFPVVLDQNIQLSKAGSSAHNIYLHVAAEMGIPALLFFLWFIWLVLKQIYNRFIQAVEPFQRAYFGGLLITFPWILAYLMTDVAIFDERALLLCVVTLAMVSIPSHVHA